MIADRLQRQRFEFKYRIPPTLVPAIRRFLSCHLVLDPYSEAQPSLAYPVYSIYLDSPDLRLCRATLNGNRNRFKLRLRYYSNSPEAPVYFEIKSRNNDCIRKQRAAVRREAVAALLGEAWPDFGHLVEPVPRELAALRAFSEQASQLAARPRAHIAYRREAWVTPDGNSLRVTFDRAVECAPQTSVEFGPSPIPALPVFGHEVILEVKFTDRFPTWIADLAESFDLARSSAAKYVDGIVNVTQGAAVADVLMEAARLRSF